MKQWYLVINVATCHDCNNCFMGCKDEHCDNDWPGYTAAQPRHGHRWMNIERHERGQYPRIDVAYRPTPCQHCENAPCVKASKGAIKRREDGIVLIDAKKAKGNKELVKSCPYGVMYWNDEEKVAQKCTMCAHLLDDKSWAPALPRCVHNCPTGTLKAYNMEPAEMAKMIKAEGLTVLKPELGTKPHVLYKNLHKFEKNFITAGVLVNGDCFENAAVTLKSGGKNLAKVSTNFFGDFKFDGLENGEYVIEVKAAGKTVSKTALINNQSLNIGYIEL